MGITIKNTAQIAGVSTSTVCIVLSGKGYIRDLTPAKVQHLIDEYNYRPSRTARQFTANRRGNIGFIISDVHLSHFEAFYSQVLLFMQELFYNRAFLPMNEFVFPIYIHTPAVAQGIVETDLSKPSA